MKEWIGKSIIGIGIIHTLFGFVVFSPTVIELLSEGLLNTVNGQTMREWAFWFIFAGFQLLILGGLVDWCERCRIEFPKSFGWTLLLFTIIIVIIMPISGGWMMFIPSIGLVMRKSDSAQTNLEVNLTNNE